MARRRVRMSRKERLYRSIGLMSAFFMLITCFALMSILVMDIIGINPTEREEGARTYEISFWTEERELNRFRYQRGEKISIPGTPTHAEDEYFKYTFRGWDITGDNKPDIVPTRAYFEFDAVAVYQKTQIKPLPKSSSEPEEPGEGSSSEAAYYAGAIILNEELVYGA